MKTIKVVYDDTCEFILDIVEDFEDKAFVEIFSMEFRKERKHAKVLQTDFGTTNLPLIVFEDENQEYYAAIWSESKPDWREEIIKYLNYV